jgi:hypothetical protein
VTDPSLRFNILLDSPKTGLRLKPGVFDKDRALFGKQIPDPDKPSDSFILHILHRTAKLEGEALLQEYDRLGQDADPPDKDLRAPYNRFSDFALNAYTERKFSGFSDQLALVREHVSKARTAFNEACQKSRGNSPEKKKKWTRKDQKDPMLVASHMYAEAVKGVSLIPNIDEVKASCAYHESPTFAFAVAFRDLCHIKACASSGGIAPTIRAFDEAKTVSGPFLRAVACVDSD